MIEPESLHSKWNDARRALRSAGLSGAVLKGTLMSNLSHGFFLGGRNQQQKEEVLEHLSAHIDIGEYLDQLAYDRDLDTTAGFASMDHILAEIKDWHSHRKTVNRGAMVLRLSLENIIDIV